MIHRKTGSICVLMSSVQFYRVEPISSNFWQLMLTPPIEFDHLNSILKPFSMKLDHDWTQEGSPLHVSDSSSCANFRSQNGLGVEKKLHVVPSQHFAYFLVQIIN